MPIHFIDRDDELAALRSRLSQPSSFSLIYGQRRTGKTCLLQRALEGRTGVLYFLADETTSTELRRRFHREATEAGHGGPGWTDQEPGDWGALLGLLLQGATLLGEPLVLVVDEVQYLLRAEPAIPSILQRLWDQLRDRGGIHLVLCGSALRTLATLGEARQPLHGRFDLRMRLRPFGYRQAAQFTPDWDRGDALRLYGVFGGIARHLAQVDPDLDLGENAVRAILDPFGPLHEAPLDLLRVESLSSIADAAAILGSIAMGENRFGAIAARVGLNGQRVDYVLRELAALDLVVREVRHGDGDGSRFARYRVVDPFVAFWFRLVRPNAGALQGTEAARIWNERVEPRLNDAMGPVFEQIVRQALSGGVLLERLGPVDEVGSYWTRDGSTQIDLIARSGGRRVFVECKWRSSRSVDLPALKQLQDHLSRYPHRSHLRDAVHCIASSTGFTSRLEQVARAEDVVLLGLDDLFSW